MTKDQAIAEAKAYVLAQEKAVGIEMALLLEHTIEFNSGWVFFYDSKKHIEGGSIRDALAGNAPVIIGKADGKLQVTGTAYPIERYIRDFEGGIT